MSNAQHPTGRRRHPARLQRAGPLLVLLAAVVLMLGANPFRGETVAPMDLLHSYSGWASAGYSLPSVHPARSDVLAYKLPAWIAMKRELREGRLPIWNDVLVNGIPGLQMVTRSALTPAFAAFALWKNDATGFYASNLLNLLIAGLGMFLFLRSLSIDRWPSSFGAFVFAFSGFHSAWLYWHHVNTSIWIPWLLLTVSGYIRQRSTAWLPGAAVCAAMMLLGGFPAVAVSGFIAAGLLALILCWSARGRATDVIVRGWPLALAVAASLPLAWLSLDPLREQLAFVGVDYRRGGTMLDYSSLLQFFVAGDAENPRPGHSFFPGLPATLLSIAAILWFHKLPNRAAAVFAAFLLAISITIACALVPKDWIRAVPGFQIIGSWARMSVLFGVGLGVLSASFLHALNRRLHRWPLAAAVVLIALTMAQFLQQQDYFDRFNGAVPGDSFLPETPTISHVATELRPMQSVIADARPFLLAGTLGSYGIPEWFAQDYRSSAEKESLLKILGAAFRTPSASTPECAHVRPDARTLALYGIRFVLCGRIGNLARGRAPRLPLTSLREIELEYVVDVPGPIQAQSMALEMVVRGTRRLAGELRLQIRQDSRLLAEASFEASRARNGQPTPFVFPTRPVLDAGTYSLFLRWRQPSPTGMIGVRMQPAPAHSINYVNERTRSGALIRSRAQELAIQSEARALEPLRPPPRQPFTGDGFAERRLEPRILVYENSLSGDSGAYYLAKLEKGQVPDFRSLRLENYRPGRVELRYEGTGTGWLVLPIRAYPGWRAFVNGEQAELRKFLDLMPAIPVAGPSSVVFEYAPVRWFIAVAISGVSWAVLLLLGVWLLWRRKA